MSNIIDGANEEQMKAITADEGPLLIVAGAGTGKTRVITSRIAWLIDQGKAKTDEILALTFTEKASGEMEERIDRILPMGYLDVWISTFHSFCDKILSRHCFDIGLSSNYRLLDETGAWLLVRNNLDRFKLDYYKPLGNPVKFIHALIKHFSRCKDEGITPKNYLDFVEELRLNTDSADIILKAKIPSDDSELIFKEISRMAELADAFHVYQELLLENNCLDFADLLNWTVKLFRERPLILEKYRRQFKYILVDEFQDTNFVQYDLIKLLGSPKNNITVVGDDDQSIYKFRGASISNIMQFKEDYPNAMDVVLVKNYRSCQGILDIAYKSIVQNNPGRLEVKLGIDKKLLAERKEQAEIQHAHVNSAEEEARFVVNKIIELKKESVTWSDFAILVRANDSADIFIEALSRAKIPYQFLAMKGLYNKPVILDVISFIKLLDNYHESPAMYRVLNWPFWKISPKAIVNINHYARKKSLSLFEALKQIAAIPGVDDEEVLAVNKIIGHIESISLKTKDKKASEIFLEIVHESGYYKYLAGRDDGKSRDDLNYLNQFFKKMQNFESGNQAARLSDFVSLMDLEMEAGETGKLAFDADEGPDMVKIMTVHSAKGLEFECVFIANLVERRFPTDAKKDMIAIPDALIREKNMPSADAHLEEERRLFYVAITRAKTNLYFTSADDYGGAKKKKISRFLAELGYKTEINSAPADNNINIPAAQMKTNETVYNIPREFSFSQIKAYNDCPLKYKFAYILNIPVFGSHYLSFGNTMHNTLYKFLLLYCERGDIEQGNLFGSADAVKLRPTLDNLLGLYNECWIDDWYGTKEKKDDYYQTGKNMLANFYSRFISDPPKVKYLEAEFKINIGQYKIKGRIDRVDELPGGKVKIIDYKTTLKTAEAMDREDKDQLILYQIAVEKQLKQTVGDLQFYYLNNSDGGSGLKEFIANEKEKKKLEDSFTATLDSIHEQDFSPAPSAYICKSCDYKAICEFKK